MKYRDLVVWEKAVDLVEKIYKITSKFPSNEKFGLSNQMQRAVVSVPSNIAEGHGRKSTGAYLNHLSIAFGSLMELETQLIIANRLRYLAEERLKEILQFTTEVSKMLNSLMFSLKRK